MLPFAQSALLFPCSHENKLRRYCRVGAWCLATFWFQRTPRNLLYRLLYLQMELGQPAGAMEPSSWDLPEGTRNRKMVD